MFRHKNVNGQTAIVRLRIRKMTRCRFRMGAPINGSMQLCDCHPIHYIYRFTILLHSELTTSYLPLKQFSSLPISTLAVNLAVNRIRPYARINSPSAPSANPICFRSFCLRASNQSFLSSSPRRSEKPEGASPSIQDLPDAGRGEVSGGEEITGRGKVTGRGEVTGRERLPEEERLSAEKG